MLKMEPELEELIRNSNSLVEVGKKLGISRASIRRRLKRRGIVDFVMYQTSLKSAPKKEKI